MQNSSSQSLLVLEQQFCESSVLKAAVYCVHPTMLSFNLSVLSDCEQHQRIIHGIRPQDTDHCSETASRQISVRYVLLSYLRLLKLYFLLCVLIAQKPVLQTNTCRRILALLRNPTDFCEAFFKHIVPWLTQTYSYLHFIFSKAKPDRQLPFVSTLVFYRL